MKSLHKALDTIDAVSKLGSGEICKIAQATGFPSATTPRFASTRVKKHSFHQDPDTKNYSLSFRFPELGIKVQQQFDITIIAHPHLQHFMSITGESANLAICDGDVVVVPGLICGRTLSMIWNMKCKYATTAFRSAPMKKCRSESKRQPAQRVPG
jgi:DNA-binding IclR family transcriptional regulator